MVDFHRLITEWYRLNFRDLPWRNTINPYEIWLSEIILQQTRVDQGLNYYLKFLNAFPTVFDLAMAEEQKVLNLWQGLGYYSRARNLHYTAKFIVEKYNGVFPKTYDEVLSLKGVGSYTAAAIVSFAYNLPFAVVDGNVYRVLSRFFGISTPIDSTKGRKEFNELAQSLILKKNPGLHNQAIMEFGAIQCVPKNPFCSSCVLQGQCVAFNSNSVNGLPVKTKKIKVRKRFFYYLLSEYNEDLIIQKREGKDIWENMYQLPLIETDLPIKEEEIITFYNLKFGVQINEFIILPKHILSHQQIFAVVGIYRGDEFNYENVLKVKRSDLTDYPLPRLIDKFLDEFYR